MATAFPLLPFANSTNIYEVNLRQYTPEGSLAAFEKHLPRLKDMGVQVLWFMPLTPISEHNRKGSLGSYYAAKSFHRVCESYGTAHDLQRLVRAAHHLGMKVMIDWVANHTGCDHEWTISNPDFYERDKHGNFMEKHGWSDVYDLNYHNPNLRLAMIDAMLSWIMRYDIDGFRCDMAHLVPLDFWMEARSACDAVKPLLWLAECEEIAYHQAFDLTYSWQWMHATEKAVKGEGGWSEARAVLKHYLHYPKRSAALLFTSNHDENSWNGTEYEKYQSRALALAAISVCAPAVPLVYSGQEIPNHKRLQFFERDTLNFSQTIALHSFYKTLLEAKQQNDCFHINASALLLDAGREDVFAFLQMGVSEKAITIFNLGKESLNVNLTNKLLKGAYRNVFSGQEQQINDTLEAALEEGEFLLLVAKRQT